MPGTTAEMVERVLDHQVEGRSSVGREPPDLTEEVMFREELVVVTAARQTLRTPLADAISDVVCVSLLYRQQLEEVLARRGVVVVRGSVSAPSTASWAA